MKSRYLGLTEQIHQLRQNQSGKVGVLLTNLGSPDAPTPAALRKYLKQFLSDPRVVEIPRLLWLTILHGIILRVRPKKSAKLYENIWTEQGAPLINITQQQANAVAAQLQQKYADQCIVEIAMRYGKPSISSALKKLQQQGVDKIIVLPLYPQYAGPTTASTFDAVIAELKTWRWIPSLNFISGYHDHPLYIKALAESVKRHIADHGKPDVLLLSYHGMPEQFLQWGDPYFCFCQKTSRLLQEALAEEQLSIETCFQSRFGKAKWLQPYTDTVLEALPQQGKKHIAIMSPAFSADCLETLDELMRESKQVFLNAGGEQYHYIPALNTDPLHIDCITQLICQQLG